jgi:hypothetical protein
MLAMQYSITLPENYDLELIRQRVERRTKLFEDLPGLSHKSYLLDEADKIYAPFYIWSEVEEAQKFLFDDLFHGVIQDFSRPRVRTWFTLAKGYGNRIVNPTYAIKEIDRIAPEEKLEEVVKAERDHHDEALRNPALYFRCFAFDSDRWEIVRYSLWLDAKSAAKPAADSVDIYSVLHVSDFALPVLPGAVD